MRYAYLLPAALLILILTISACGRKGDPMPPEKITNSQWVAFV